MADSQLRPPRCRCGQRHRSRERQRGCVPLQRGEGPHGTAGALILEVLGVDAETIAADYILTNESGRGDTAAHQGDAARRLAHHAVAGGAAVGIPRVPGHAAPGVRRRGGRTCGGMGSVGICWSSCGIACWSRWGMPSPSPLPEGEGTFEERRYGELRSGSRLGLMVPGAGNGSCLCCKSRATL